MIARDLILKKVSESRYHELQRNECDSKPISWTQRLKSTHLPIENIEIATTFNTNDRSVQARSENANSPLMDIQPNVTISTSIKAIVDSELMRDRIYTTVDADEEDCFTVEQVSGQTLVEIKTAEPTKEDDEFNECPPGVYPGVMFRYDCDPGEDDLHITLTCPESHMEKLVRLIRQDPSTRFEICIEALCFTSEMDESLREPYHPQQLVFTSSTDVFLTTLRTTSKTNNIPLTSQFDEEDDSEELPRYEQANQVDASKTFSVELVKGLVKPLNQIAFSIWLLIAVLVTSLFVN